MSNYVLCYDISEPKRLNRIARKLKKEALRIQKSIFIFQGSFQNLTYLINQILPLIEVSEDDFRVYEVSSNGAQHIGIPATADGVYLSF